ncbi:MAG: 2,3-dihydroxyphenylpropionate 1,2-dioxygenase [Betaproteobacteria bacterium]|jgi:aromatic ring-opening dioxygenase catalytic subunit (LigB family)|nr:2,3-dihydroxyphenylpropionate 1,2-dioxygenase [Betaproteobacteria bacterium]MDH5341612.1 2,3-dihydroxyphenylpropionate 1,2-dioxygenase [Betaproteobacteria bacterium]
MAKLAGVYAASHGPLIIRKWDSVSAAHKEALTGAFDELGRRIRAARLDALVIISPDHWVNFFIDNLPMICVGVGETHAGPNEPWMMKEFPHETMPGHPQLARHILDTALASGFEPSVSHRMILDHGFCIPLLKAGVNPLPIVPVVFNDIEPPFPTVSRCYAWGEMLARAIATMPGDLRVGVLGSGGLSHSIGEATMGLIEEEFDRECINHFEQGDPAALCEFLTQRLPQVGNGGSEIRNWVAAHGAAGGRGFELINYSAVPEVIVGCGFAAWNLHA